MWRTAFGVVVFLVISVASAISELDRPVTEHIEGKRPHECRMERKGEGEKGANFEWVDADGFIHWYEWEEEVEGEKVKRLGLLQSLTASSSVTGTHSCALGHYLVDYYAVELTNAGFSITLKSWYPSLGIYTLQKDDQTWLLMLQRQGSKITVSLRKE
jgi:hypothetical protein